LSILDETTISRRHAELSRQGDTITVSDLGSTNGTYVNGVKLTSAAILRPGDQVQFGAVRFRYEG
jgi:pSer/pThr/pTyr-binding forkhead associated (FHA) protein